ncbi:sporadic carbohydrate cluster 2OG-Fe(II) oxygenase [Acanthopleuribacter pedis]|uniref:Uncharacterized protein n=1 Tax=Acanthopleuribacter pedis TaxID=442870 RepID=A0A8J7QBP0_9BACT|nr:sporadic carbohydrate cluster 2OG-Fe(II) oxygenase [Acanthopleuribacter pedis]MBO1317996.1 hypothetical protein [Acanthopleuribacter pedis]
MTETFFEADEQQAIDQYLQQGFVSFELDATLLDSLRERLFTGARSLLDLPADLSVDAFFDQIHTWVPVADLNRVRLGFIRHLNGDPSVRPLLYRLAKQPLGWIVGNELAMQRSLNLSIQFPKDASSLLPLHSDVWSGNSPYEVVFWLPLVDCYATKSMYVLPKPQTDAVLADFGRYADLSAEAFFQAIKADVVWMEVPRGHGLIFWHGLIHGNRINEENDTRWSMNTRFKSLLSPYGTKELGESFLPITLRPATRFGYAYRKPSIHKRES